MLRTLNFENEEMLDQVRLANTKPVLVANVDEGMVHLIII